jgi:hypothetical protein
MEFLHKVTTMEMLLQWKWAEAHPYLYTLIKTSQPYLIAVIFVVGGKLIANSFNIKRR